MSFAHLLKAWYYDNGGAIMGIILRDDKLAEFIARYELDCSTIIIKYNHKNRTAHFIIDGKTKVEANYQELIKYAN